MAHERNCNFALESIIFETLKGNVSYVKTTTVNIFVFLSLCCLTFLYSCTRTPVSFYKKHFLTICTWRRRNTISIFDHHIKYILFRYRITCTSTSLLPKQTGVQYCPRRFCNTNGTSFQEKEKSPKLLQP